MTGRLEYLREYKAIENGGFVTFGNNSNGQIMGFGTITNGNLTINRVAYVNGLKHNLVSVGMLCRVGYAVSFTRKFSFIMSEDHETCFLRSAGHGKMYPLDLALVTGKPSMCLLSRAMSEVSWMWHRRLAHLNFRYLNQLVTDELVRGLPPVKFDDDTLCAACECGKQTKKSHKAVLDSSISKPLELLHMDLCGPSSVASLGQKEVHLSDR